MVTLAVGTEKGAFLFRSEDRRRWQMEGPIQPGWKVTAFGKAPGGDHLMGVGSNWFGAAIHRSADLREWEQIVDGPAWEEGSDRKLNNVWFITRSGDTLYAGVDDAGLFRSDDDGVSWSGVEGFNEHDSRPHWYPGAGGLAAHRLLIDPDDPNRMWLAVSAVGVFRTADGGDTWQLRDVGVTQTAKDDEHPDVGFCVHCIVADPDDADTIWRQDHSGVYRTGDGAESWQRIENGLPANFGFPIVRDPHTGALFVAPQESDQHRMPVDGEFAVYRSTDGGDSWHVSGVGHPAAAFFGAPLRGAMVVDGFDPCGIYLGTTAGTVHFSSDGGDTWSRLPEVLPRILTVSVAEA